MRPRIRCSEQGSSAGESLRVYIVSPGFNLAFAELVLSTGIAADTAI